MVSFHAVLSGALARPKPPPPPPLPHLLLTSATQARVDLVLIQPFLLDYIDHVVPMHANYYF